ncbi:MAG: hypothetical protein U1E21_17080 [Reyranellaceae bacterium]
MRVSIALAMQTLRGRLSKLPDAVPEMPDVVSEIPDPVQKFPVPNPCSGPAGQPRKPYMTALYGTFSDAPLF